MSSFIKITYHVTRGSGQPETEQCNFTFSFSQTVWERGLITNSGAWRRWSSFNFLWNASVSSNWKKKKSQYDKIKGTCTTKITSRNRNHHFSIWSFTSVFKSNAYFLPPFKTICHLIFNILSLSNIFYFPKADFLRLFRTLIFLKPKISWSS